LIQLGWLAVAAGGGGVILINNLWHQQPSEPITQQPPSEPITQPIFSESKFEVVTVNRKGEITAKAQKKAKSFQEDLGKGVILEMVAIPRGKFMMGTDEQEIERRTMRKNCVKIDQGL